MILMTKNELNLREMNRDEFEAKCKAMLDMRLEEGEMTKEQEQITNEINEIWLYNGGHEVVNKLLSKYPNRKLISESQIDEFADLVFDEVCTWIKSVL